MITEDSPLIGVGARVRAARKLTPDLTQQRLADRAHVSLWLVRAVEQVGFQPLRGSSSPSLRCWA